MKALEVHRKLVPYKHEKSVDCRMAINIYIPSRKWGGSLRLEKVEILNTQFTNDIQPDYEFQAQPTTESMV